MARRIASFSLGLCCQFAEAPIKFRTSTALALSRLTRRQARERLAQLCLHNAQALQSAILYCSEHGIGCFRIGSQFFPLKTHPTLRYDVAGLPGGATIISTCQKGRKLAREKGIRLTFHPDQFVVLNSPRKEVVRQSIAELEYQAEAAALVGADVITIHAGGTYGDIAESLDRLEKTLKKLASRVRQRLALENDDISFAPADLLPLCERTGIPFVYDVHHHRCLRDNLNEEQATKRALLTWNRRPLFHLSSPLGGWKSSRPRSHADYIAPADFPACWRKLSVTIEVEAKAKELAISRLRLDLGLGTGRVGT